MLSRVADSIYWMSRYLERAENVARFIEVNLNLMLDTSGSGDGNQWEPLVNITGDRELFAQLYGVPTKENVMQFLTFDRANPNSILSCVWKARENARSMREIISSEMWEQANNFYMLVKNAVGTDAINNPHAFYTEVKMASHLFDGIADATMSHGQAWHFLRLGEMLERAEKTSRILDVKYFILLPGAHDVGSTIDNIQWAALLRSASAFEMYRKRYRRITPDKVADFLILNSEFPRAVRYCLDRARESLHAIGEVPLGLGGNRAERRLGRLSAELNYAQIDEIIAQGLHEFLDDLQTKLNRIDDAIFETFFAFPAVTTDSARAQSQ